jgi:pyridoxal phosphate enzyme (YggS family)
MSSLQSRYQEVLRLVAQSSAQRSNPHSIQLLAVSKRQPIEAIEELYQYGQRDFGENYVQELIEKSDSLRRKGYLDIRWHFIGHLQSNKVKSLIPHVASIHALESEKTANELAKRWRDSSRSGQLPIFIEVNIDEEATKSGLSISEVPGFAQLISKIPELSLQGLMCIPAINSDPKSSFRRLRELEEKCRPWTRGQLSMGMSQDYPIAIQEGATHVRVGTVLFGPR